MTEKDEINPYDLEPKDARNFFLNEIKLGESNPQIQRQVARALGFLNGMIKTKKMAPEDAGPFAVDIYNAWFVANAELIDRDGLNAGVDEQLIEGTRQLVASSFGIDLSLGHEDHF